jgi:hypothetical protein
MVHSTSIGHQMPCTVHQGWHCAKPQHGCCAPLAGAIAYSGPFVPSYRASLLADWTAKLVEVGLPHSPHANLIKTLADPVQVILLNYAVAQLVAAELHSCM